MIEKIYDTIRGILYSDFPKDNTGTPYVYDRQIANWFFGDRKVVPSPLGVILKGTTSNIKDVGFGLREIEYSIGLQFYSSNDDQETSERVIQEVSRIAHSILKKHRSMWVCDLCPFCGKLPLSPIHYIDTGVVTSVGIITGISTTFAIYGTTGPAYIRLSAGISGHIVNSEILSCGLGVSTNYYSSSGVAVRLGLSSGSGHTGYSTTYINSYLTNTINQINTYWQETHTTDSPAYYDWAGVAYRTVQSFMSDWSAGYKDSNILSNTVWSSNLNSLVDSNVNLVRFLQDIQVGDIKPSDDGVDQMFLHFAEFTLKAKEIISVDQFGPNNVNVNAI
jgi:hypothetical protein